MGHPRIILWGPKLQALVPIRSSRMSNGLEIVRAGDGNLDGVLAVLEEAAEWLVAKGIEGPWRPGFFSRQAFADQIARGEVYVSRLGEETVGTITLQWSDELFWPGASSDAGYVHKFAVRPAYLGRGFGLQMLEWASRTAELARKTCLRLNCLATNRKLRDYYEKAGFIHVDDVEVAGWKFSLYQKNLDSEGAEFNNVKSTSQE